MKDPVEILLVEDSPSDVVLIQEALKDGRIDNPVHVATDGQAALDFLHFDRQTNPDKIRPGLILLDLHLPKVGGLEVLKTIKSDPDLKSIPTIIMTVSQEEADVANAYEFQANSYVIKPVDYDQLLKVIKTIESFWLSLVRLPRG